MKQLVFFIVVLCLVNSIQGQDEVDRLLYINDDWQPYTMLFDGSEKEQLVDFFGLRHPDWSPNGNGFVGTGMEWQIYRFDLLENTVTQLTHSDGRNYRPVWTPDGTKIAFVSDRTGKSQLYMMNPDGTDQRQLLHSEFVDGDHGLTWVFDGRYLAFVREEEIHFDEETQTYEQQNLYLLDVEDGERQPINLTSHIDYCDSTGDTFFNPTWTDQSNRLAFAVGCGDHYDVYVVEAKTVDDLIDFNVSDLTQAVFEYQAGYRGLTWSPLGNMLAFIALVDDETRSAEIITLDVNATIEREAPIYNQITNAPEAATFYGVTWIDS